jgi:hypothetical protein
VVARIIADIYAKFTWSKIVVCGCTPLDLG